VTVGVAMVALYIFFCTPLDSVVHFSCPSLLAHGQASMVGFFFFFFCVSLLPSQWPHIRIRFTAQMETWDVLD